MEVLKAITKSKTASFIIMMLAEHSYVTMERMPMVEFFININPYKYFYFKTIIRVVESVRKMEAPWSRMKSAIRIALASRVLLELYATTTSLKVGNHSGLKKDLLL
jgi:hypothetical protein